MATIRLSLSFLALLATQAYAHPLKLECQNANEVQAESARLRSLSGDMVRRRSKHQLTVITRAGSRQFTDQPPHDEPLSGVHYHFCARKDGWVLLTKDNQGVFTGVLVNETTGQVAPAGETVLFSEDRRAYLATEQPDGLDGNVWSVYSVDGRKSWSGYSFISRDAAQGTIDSTLSDPAWTPTGELTATATCLEDLAVQWQVKLVKKAGAWDWQPRKRCGPARQK
jgi:hypothetical protein